MKNSTRAKKLHQVSEHHLIIGVDIGSEKNYARAMNWRGEEYTKKAFFFPNNEKGFLLLIKWIEEIQARSGLTEVIIGCEPTGVYWLCFKQYLTKKGFKIVTVNTLHVHRSKELDDNSPSKDDKKDPRVIADLVREGRFFEPYDPQGDYAEIRSLFNVRESVVKNMARARNRMQAWLRRNFPEYLNCYSKYDSKGGLAVLEIASLPRDVYELGVDGILLLWKSKKMRGTGGRKKAEKLVEAAAANMWLDYCAAEKVAFLYILEDFRRNSERLEELDRKLEEQVRRLPNVDKLLSIRGVGMQTVVGFIAEVGDVNRFSDPKQLVKLAGLNAINNESCKKVGEHRISKRGRSALGRVMYEAAGSLIAWNSAFKALQVKYTTRTTNPLKRRQARVVVACKALRIFHAILRKGVDFDPSKVIHDPAAGMMPA